jgi:hypothetical protein
MTGVKSFPLHPSQPQRICWGCDQYCSVTDMRCGNGSVRTPHPAESFGEDWQAWGLDADAGADGPAHDATAKPVAGSGSSGRP